MKHQRALTVIIAKCYAVIDFCFVLFYKVYVHI